MNRIGLKVWSINFKYAQIADKLYNEGVFDYLEISAIPDSFKNTSLVWKNLHIPCGIHAPHFGQGLDFSVPFLENNNIKLAEETFRFADFLNAEYIIFHPGIKGDYIETARQMKRFKDKRILIENKPHSVIINNENQVCVGYNPEEIKYIKDNTGVGFCLDIGHCFCAANCINKDKYDMLKEFLSLKPDMFHISDGESEGKYDKHYLIGEGSYDFNKIFSLLPKNIRITIETEKPSKDNLDAFIKDSEKLKKFMQ